MTHGQAQQPDRRETLPDGDHAVRGVVDIDGQRHRFSYHFDHNALREAVAAGDSLIALTASGNLLRFDASTLAMTAQTVVPERATALALDAEGRVLAGTEDGRTAFVDIETLNLTEFQRGEGSVRWLAPIGDGLVTVISPRAIDAWPGEPFAAYERRAGSKRRWSVLVRRGTRTSRYELPEGVAPNAFAVDAATLWMGIDRGEYGGSLYSMNLQNGRTSQLQSSVAVRGLLQIANGQVLAYGGTDHLGVRSGFIGRIDSGRVRMLSEFAGGRGTSPAEGPDAPVDLVVASSTTGGFLVASGRGLYRTNPSFSAWSRWASLGGRRGSGTLYATSALLQAPGDDMVAVLARDGLVRLSTAGIERRVIPDQLEAPIADIWPTSIGTLFLPPGGRYLWRFPPEGWTTLEMCPEQLAGVAISSGVPVQDIDSGIVSFCGPGIAPGTAALVHVDTRGDIDVEHTWPHRLGETPDQFVVDSSGRVLARSGLGHQELQAWSDGAWHPIGTAAVTDSSSMTGRRGRAHVPLAASPDGGTIMWDVGNGAILRLYRSSARSEAELRLDPVNVPELAMVLDAVVDGDGILVATPRGIFRYAPASARIERLRSPLGDAIRTLTRDSRGRLWVAGDGVWMSPDGAGRSWLSVDLPMASSTTLKRLRPASEGGLWLSVYDRGLVFLE